jgi:hypothetical protein
MNLLKVTRYTHKFAKQKLKDELNKVFDLVYKDISKLIEGQVTFIVNQTRKMPQVM